MKIAKLIALVAVTVTPCLVARAQTPPIPPGTTPPAGGPSQTTASPIAPVPSTTAGDSLVKPPEAPVVAHGSGPDAAPEPGVQLTNEPSDEIAPVIAFDSAPLPDAVSALALQAGLNIQFDPKLMNTVGPDGHTIPITPPNITAKWKNVTAKQALSALLDNWGWQLVTVPNNPIGRITAKNPAALEPLITTVVQLQYGNPSNIVSEVGPTLSTRSSIVTDSRTHQLIVRTTEREMPEATNLIVKLDTPTRQVLIEAKIVETSKNILSAKGVDWTKTLAAQNISFGNGNTGGTLTQVPVSGTVPVTTGTTTLPGGTTVPTQTGGGILNAFTNTGNYITTIPGLPSSAGGLSVNTARGFNPATAFLNADGVQAVLSFLNSDADTRQIAFPRTVALDGVQTVLAVVQNIPIFEQQQSAPAAGASQGLATVLPNYDKEVRGTILNEVGVKLTVVPRIAGFSNVLMDLRPEISTQGADATSTLDGQINTSPTFNRRSIVTQAAVPSGYTLVLGGLESDNNTHNMTKVPFIGDVPGLGWLFRSDNKNLTKDTILIFVTPTIIRDADFQPGESSFLRRKGPSPSDIDPPPWDTAKPYDWTKPKPGVEPSYQP
jgi:type II secretory pathway component GspD/PulD (secretin)